MHSVKLTGPWVKRDGDYSLAWRTRVYGDGAEPLGELPAWVTDIIDGYLTSSESS